MWIPLPDTQGSLWELEKKHFNQRQWMNPRKQQDSCCTYELTAIVTVFPTPEQAQARQNLSREGEATYEVAEDLLEMCSCWKRESVFFNIVAPGMSPMLSDGNHTFKNTWPAQIIFERSKEKKDSKLSSRKGDRSERR